MPVRPVCKRAACFFLLPDLGARITADTSASSLDLAPKVLGPRQDL